MKSKLLAITAAVILLAGCQAQIDENLPQNEVNIDQNEALSGAENQGIQNEGSSSNTSDEKDTIEDSSMENEQGSLDEIDENDTSSINKNGSNEGIQSWFEANYGLISADNLEAGILEGCTLVEALSDRFNATDLKKVSFEGIYEDFWEQSQDLGRISKVKELLSPYFTNEVVEDLVLRWGLLQYDDHLYAPEISAINKVAMQSVSMTISEVDPAAVSRYVNFNFTDAYGVAQNSLMLLKKQEDGTWKIDTVPGTGVLERHGNRLIRDAFWSDPGVSWNWPNFIVAEEKAWGTLLKPVRLSIEQDINSRLSAFVPDASFSKIGARQLSFWVDWDYGEENEKYPHIDITQSEYMKYGIHPNHIKQSVTIDKERGTILKLASLYTDNKKFYELVNIAIDRYMTTHEDEFYDEVHFEGISEDTQFYLTEDGIVFYFQLYEYAPYAFGYPEVKVDFTELKDVLSPEFMQFVH